MINKESQSKHWASKDVNIIQSYWDSPPATKRSKWFAEQLSQYKFTSIFEVGFFAGRNLRYIKDGFPKVTVSGLEINVKAARFAREKLGMNANDLRCADLHDVDRHKIGSTFDIVFSSGVLIHVPPEDIKSAIEIMIGLSNMYVMHIESLGKNEVSAGPKHLKPTYKVSGQMQWAPDIVSVYNTLGYEPSIIPLPDDCKTNGASELVVVEL